MNQTSTIIKSTTETDQTITFNRGSSPPHAILSSEALKISEIVMDFVLNFTIAFVGVVNNVLVLIVFTKQGFKDSVNISMTTIALWDLAKCLGGAMQRVSGPMAVWSVSAAHSWTNISIVVFNYLICFSSYVTSVLAAYVAVERCLCVSIPFKVKWLITPKVTLFACVIISVVVFGWFAVIYGIYDIIWVYDTSFNSTIAVYRHNSFYLANEGPLFEYYNLSGIIWPVVSFFVIVISTAIIIYKLKETSNFRSRQTDMVSQSVNQLSSRDRQVVKMLLVIIAVYVCSLFPRICLYMAKFFIYDFYFLRKYHNFFLFVCYFLYIFDLANGAVNFYIFYFMSSSFKATFLSLFCARKQWRKKGKFGHQSQSDTRF